MPVQVLIVGDPARCTDGAGALAADEASIAVVDHTGVNAGTAPSPAADVVLVDMAACDGDATETVRRLAADVAALPVCALAMSERESDLLRPIGAGARGCTGPTSSSAELARSLHLLAAGGLCYPPALAAQVLRAYSRPVAGADVRPTDLGDMSEAERAVLGLVAAGSTYSTVVEAFLRR